MTDNTVQNYGWRNPTQPQSGEYITPKVIDILKAVKAQQVLDLGAGNGAMCGTLEQAGFQVAGLEYDKHGHSLAQKAHPGIHFYNFGVQDDPALIMKDEAPFDAVVSTEVVEHLFSPHLLPQYAHSCLKPGGHLIISTPYHGYFKNLVLAVLGKWDSHHGPLWHGGHIKFWSKSTLTALLAQNGFEVIDFHGVGRAPYVWKSMILVARKV
jgi:2-polyprenyl-3-methyl-5-hydroxy-6-metoxy-1,4-benzoquinol methylase